jgi:hypothetical protein
MVYGFPLVQTTHWRSPFTTAAEPKDEEESDCGDGIARVETMMWDAVIRSCGGGARRL